MSDSYQLVQLELLDAPAEAPAEEWVPLTVVLRRPAGSGTSAYLKYIDRPDKEVQLDTDAFPGLAEIGPGEDYRLTLRLKAPYPRPFDLGDLVFQVGTDPKSLAGDQSHRLAPRTLPFRPAIARQVVIGLKTLCQTDDGTKVELTFRHQGRTDFADFTMTLGPPSSLRAGKHVIHRDSFGPEDGGKEHSEILVVQGDQLVIDLAGTADGGRTTAQFVKAIDPVAAHGTPAFRFLDPKRLSRDEVTIRDKDAHRAIAAVHAVYPLHGSRTYEIEIKPQLPNATEVRLRDLPGVAHVLKDETAPVQGAWRFLVELSSKGRLSQTMQLYYEVVTPGEKLTGEVPICLKPPPWAHAIFAITLGAAVTAQGVAALAQVLFKPGYSLEDAVERLHPADNYHLWLSLLAIPIAWIGIVLLDRIQYRLRE